MKPLRPITDPIRLLWLRFKRDTQCRMSPYLPALVIEINRIENRSLLRRR